MSGRAGWKRKGDEWSLIVRRSAPFRSGGRAGGEDGPRMEFAEISAVVEMVDSDDFGWGVMADDYGHWAGIARGESDNLHDAKERAAALARAIADAMDGAALAKGGAS